MRSEGMRAHLTLLAALAVACGGDDTATIDAGDAGDVDGPVAIDAAVDGAPDAAAGAFTLTSPTVTEGGVIPVAHSCRGANTSPALAWTGGPAAASYAVVLTDRSNGLIHSIIWDVPASRVDLPADVDKVAEPPDVPGAKQPLAYDTRTRGYLGPCPGSTHTYEFKLYALDVATLPGATLSSTRTQLAPILDAHALATTTLTATFTP